TATSNLKNVKFEASDPKDVVIDTGTVDRTCIRGPQWLERDFPKPPQIEEPDSEENETPQIEAGAASNGDGAKDQKKLCQPRMRARKIMETVSLEEAQRRVQSAAQQWLMEAAGIEAKIAPG